jgi:hypothetical protein
VAVLFAAFLGYNPIQTLLGPNVLHQLSPANQATLTGQSYFPHLISPAFHSGLAEAFAFAAVASLIAAAASWSRGKRSAPDVANLSELNLVSPGASLSHDL